MRKTILCIATLAALAAAQMFREDLGQKVTAKVFFTDEDRDGVLSGLETGTIRIHLSNTSSQDIYKLTIKAAVPVHQYDTSALVPLAKCGLPRMLKTPSLPQMRAGGDTTVDIPLQATGFCMDDAKIGYDITISFQNSPGIWSSSYTINKHCEIPLAFSNKPPLKTNEAGYCKWVRGNSVDGYGGIAIGSDGAVYWNGNAYSPDGTRKWISKGFFTVAIGSDGTVYCVGETLFAFNADGSVKWRLYYQSAYASEHADRPKWRTDPVVGPDGTIYLSVYVDVFVQRSEMTRDEYNFIVACSPEGKIKWYLKIPRTMDEKNFPILQDQILGLAVGRDGTVYGTTRESCMLFAVTPSGILKWKRQLTTDKMFTAPVIASDGTIYVGGWDSDNSNLGILGATIYACNPQGTLKWRYWTKGAVTGGLAVGPDGTVYAPIGTEFISVWMANPLRIEVDNPGLYAVNPDGTLKWFYKDARLILSTPAIGSDGKIFFLDRYGITVIDQNGKFIWTKQYDDDATLMLQRKYVYVEEYALGNPAIGPDGTLYFGDGTNLYAYVSGSPGPADGQWPKSGHDNSNTGRVGGK